MNFDEITIDNFMTSTAVAYMLLMIVILLLANLSLRGSDSSQKSQ